MRPTVPLRREAAEVCDDLAPGLHFVHREWCRQSVAPGILGVRAQLGSRLVSRVLDDALRLTASHCRPL